MHLNTKSELPIFVSRYRF